MYDRKIKNEVAVGHVIIGGNHPISIQSMTNTDTRDSKATVEQILRLEEAGCEIIRVAVPDQEAAEALVKIRKSIHIPIVADIHFDYRLALTALKNGVDKLRINPGNIGGKERVAEIVAEARKRSVPIRVGVNAGSLDKELLQKYGHTAEAMVASALKHIAMIENTGYDQIIISIKASSVPLTLASYQLLSQKVNYPLHIGITEAGTLYSGSIKSAVGIGALLAQGIGDTLRVSLTGNPLEEIKCAKQILQSLGLRQFQVEFISCPTCGRTQVDLVQLATEIENKCQFIRKPIKIAVMGCVVNGPGEAADADIGIAGGKGSGIIFKKGKVVCTVPEDQLISRFLAELKTLGVEAGE